MLLSNHILLCLIKISQRQKRFWYAQCWKNVFNKMVSKFLLIFNTIKAFLLSLYCFSVGRLFYIVFKIKMLLQSKLVLIIFVFVVLIFKINQITSYIFISRFFEVIIVLSSYFLNKSVWKKISSNSRKGKRQAWKTRSCIFVAEICEGDIVPL